MATKPERLPLTGLIQAATVRTPVQIAQMRDSKGASTRH
jgi:hypothetical protein